MNEIHAQLQKFLIGKFSSNPLNRLPKEFGGSRIFSNPIFGVASGEDPIFEKFKEVVGPKHLTPLEMWLANGKSKLNNSDLKIVSIAFP